MSQSISLWGADYSGVPAVDLPKTGGGTATFTDTSDANATAADILTGKTAYVNGVKITGTNSGGGGGGSVTQDENGYIILPSTSGGGGGTWAWYGMDAELIETVKQTVALKDTDFNTWTPSTTQTAIYTATAPSTALDTDFSQYTYLCVLKFVFDPVYATGTTLLAAPTRFISIYTHERYYIPSSVSDWANDNRNSQNAYSSPAIYRLFYKSTSGVDSIIQTIYGVYCTNLTYSTSTKKFSAPVYARCNDSYCSTTMATAMDKTNSTFTYEMSVYRIPADKSVANGAVDTIVDLYQNGIT